MIIRTMVRITTSPGRWAGTQADLRALCIGLNASKTGLMSDIRYATGQLQRKTRMGVGGVAFWNKNVFWHLEWLLGNATGNKGGVWVLLCCGVRLL